MNRVEQAVRKSGFFKAGSRVIVGFSGGADSTALLHCLAVRCGVSVIACHVNHLLRGEESDRDEQAVRLFCRTYHIPLEIQRIDVAAVARREQCGLEEAGRMVRIVFLKKCVRRIRRTGLQPHTPSRIRRRPFCSVWHAEQAEKAFAGSHPDADTSSGLY